MTNTVTLNTTNELKNNCGKIKYEELYKLLLSKNFASDKRAKIEVKLRLKRMYIYRRKGEKEGEVNEGTRQQNGFI